MTNIPEQAVEAVAPHVALSWGGPMKVREARERRNREVAHEALSAALSAVSVLGLTREEMRALLDPFGLGQFGPVRSANRKLHAALDALEDDDA